MISKLNRTDIILAISLYVLTLAIVSFYAINSWVILSDQLREYDTYLEVIAQGGWTYSIDNLVASSLTITLLPAFIQMLTMWNPEMVFKMTPGFMYALLPIFIYLLSRRYFSRLFALIPPAFTLSSFYFLWDPSTGRVSIAQAFLAGLIWAILGRRYIWSAVFVVLLVFSHYGTTYIAMIIIASALVYQLLRRWNWNNIRILATALSLLLMSSYVWYYQISVTPATYAEGVARRTAASAMTAVKTTPDSIVGNPTADFWKLESRDPVVQAAFGKTWPVMNVAQKVEFIWSWLIVIVMSAGLAYSLKTGRLPVDLRVMSVCMYALILLTIAVPYLSYSYGVIRVYFTGMIMLTPMMALCIEAATRRVKKMALVVVLVLLVPHALAVSGILHHWLGLTKG